MSLKAYQDPKNSGNSEAHHTGLLCVEKDCCEPAGTHWSHLWCFKHNVERMDRMRMDRISANLDAVAADFGIPKST